MPSPFPGMDPYLEGSSWTSVHTELSVEIARQLAPRLQPRYVARTNERFVVTEPETEDGVSVSTAGIYPDAFVTAARPGPFLAPAQGRPLAPAPLRVATVMPETVRLLSVEIRDVAQRQLVAAIEVLSPTHKRGEGRQEYLVKRRRVLLSAAHLLEIDLLRSGQRVPMREPLPGFPYFVILSRADKRPLSEVWPVAAAEPLPTVPVPLLPGDADVPLDLQSALAAVYDTFGYALTLDYARPPEVPMESAEAAGWAEQTLAAWRASRPTGG